MAYACVFTHNALKESTMKRMALSALLLLLVVALGLSGFWWWQSDLIQKQFESTARLTMLKISHESLAKSGYPLHPGVHIVHPGLQLTSGAMNLSMDLDNLTIEKSLIGNQFRLLYGKNGSFGLNAHNRQWDVRFQAQGESTLALDFEGPWNFPLSAEASQPLAWLSRLRQVTQHSAPAQWMDKNGAVLITSGGGQITGTIQPMSGAASRHAWYITTSKIQYTAAYDTLMQDMLGTLLGQAQPSNLAFYGPISMDFGLKFSMPQQGMANPFQSIDFAIEPAKFTSDLGVFDLALAVKQQMNQGGALDGTVHFNVLTNLTPRADQVMAQSLLQMLRDPKMAERFPATKGMSDAQLWPIVGIMTPRNSTLGNIHEALEMNYRIDMSKQNHHVEVTQLALETAPYGLIGKGNGTLNPGSGPMIDATIECRGCETLFHDLTSYIDRVKQGLSALTAGSPRDPVVGALLDRPVSLIINQAVMQLKALSSAAGDGTVWGYRIEQSATHPMTINDHPLEQFLPILATLAQLRPVAAIPAEVSMPSVPKQ